jgi:NADH-quinone oxidoreductase subunit D
MMLVAQLRGHLVDLGSDHPGMDGAPTFDLQVTDEVITAARMSIGWVHRGAEKLLESRDYNAGLALCDRHDWLGALCSEVGFALTVEQACGILAPPRAQLIRLLLAELNRVGHHLAFLAALPGAQPDWAEQMWALREQTLAVMQATTGQRIHPMFVVVGGVRADLGAALQGDLGHLLDDWSAQFAQLAGEPLSGMLQAYRGVAVLPAAVAAELGASGPVARASGIDADLRRDRASHALPYPESVLIVPTLTAGDAAARIQCLAAEVPVSLALMSWALRSLQGSSGPVAVRLPKVLRVPSGTYYGAFENPGGTNGYLLVSRNEPMPYRLKIRSAGFANAAACQRALVGTAQADLAHALASFFLISGDIDR